MLRIRTTTAAVTLAAMLGGGAACGGGEDPGPTANPSTSESLTESTEPTSTTAPAWQQKYTDQQLDAYEAALERWDEYEARSEPIWSRGQATQAAEDFFKLYFPSPTWRDQYRQLQAYEDAGITLEGRPEVYWSKAKSISKNALSVVIQQCVDYTAITGSQDGAAIEREPWAEVPRVQTISLSKPNGYGWLVFDLEDSTSETRPPRCVP